MKRIGKLLGILGFVAAVAAIGFNFYFNTDDRGKATEAAAEAVADAAAAAVEWTMDRTERTVEVVALLGQGPSNIAVTATLTVKGARNLSAVCASMPRVHDAINVILFDGVRNGLSAGRAPAAAELASFEPQLKDALNRSYETPAVEAVRLAPAPRRVLGDSGCNERAVARQDLHPSHK